MIGMFSFIKAYNFAISKGYDLVLLNEGDIPVVKIADYNKLLYDMKKKQKEQKKNQNIQKIKEIVFGLNIAENDYNTKLNHIKEFLSENDKVKVTVKMDRRIALNSPETGFEFANKIINDLLTVAECKKQPKLLNNLIFLNFDPIKK